MPVRQLPKEPGPVEYLLYVEDYWSYHPRGHDAAQACARIFHALGIDYGILGHEEKTLGDSQRLAGEKGLFEMLVEQVVETLDKYEFGQIVTPDPHGFNALKTVYPKYGHTFDVVHYTQLLAPLVDKLEWTKELDYTVTFHDPCYLGRHHGEYDAPRTLLEAIPGVKLTEMMRCRENGYCCGGGGGGMWLDAHTQNHTVERLSERRVKEAVESGADVLAVCCPYEVSRFEDAAKSTNLDGPAEGARHRRADGRGDGRPRRGGGVTNLRVVDVGTVGALRSQALWHGIASAIEPDAGPTLSLCRPSEAYVSIGYHRSIEEIDREFCRAEGLPVLRRRIGGGPVLIDSDQLFFGLTLPVGKAPAGVDRLYATLLEPAAAAFRALGLDARIDGMNDIAVGPRKVSGTGAGQFDEGVVVVGNVILRFDHERMARVLALPGSAMRAECLRLMRRHVSSLEDEGLARRDARPTRPPLCATPTRRRSG